MICLMAMKLLKVLTSYINVHHFMFVSCMNSCFLCCFFILHAGNVLQSSGSTVKVFAAILILALKSSSRGARRSLELYIPGGLAFVVGPGTFFQKQE
jgi:hypothetical protein